MKAQDVVLRTIKESPIPLSANSISELMRTNTGSSYTVQYIKRILNQLLNKGRLEVRSKSGRTELFSIPGQHLDPDWEVKSDLKERPVKIQLQGDTYTAEQFAGSMLKTANHPNFAPFLRDEVGNELIHQVMALIAAPQMMDYFNANSLSPVKDIRVPLQNLLERIEKVSELLTVVLNNDAIRTGRAAQSVSNKMLDAYAEKLDPYLQQLSMNKRSDTNSD